MVDRRWSAGEMAVLIEAWKPLYNRRRGGESDVWVPASQRSRARSTRTLVPEDWRAVATAVNSFRSEINLNPIRTHKQCKMRVELLKSQFGEEQLATPSWLGFLSLYNTVGARGLSSLRVPATAAVEAHGGDECGGGAAGGGQARGGSAVGEGGGSVAAELKRGVVMGVPVGAATENASDGVAVEVEVEDGGTATAPEEALGSGAASDDPPSGPVHRSTAAAMGFLGGPIPKKRRTGASTTTSAGGGDGLAPSVKEEMVREANARRAPAAVVAAEMAATLGSEIAAAHSSDVTVVENILKEASTLYREVTAQRIELQKQMVAALAAAMGGATVAVPDAARV